LPAPGYSNCAKCRERRFRNKTAQRFRDRRAELGLCVACGRANDGDKTTCVTCRAKVSLARNRLVAGYRLQGLCACGERAASVGATCEPCWYKSRARTCAGSGGKWEALRNLLVAQGFRCAYSGKLLVLGPDATIDHKIPRSRGGTNEISNLQWVSRRVNNMKTDFTHEEFVRACEVIAKRWQQNQKPTESARKSTVKLVA
jgi:5-methylcytosine-specific restriction endonuclease McrA